jgi:hypothetical protein
MKQVRDEQDSGGNQRQGGECVIQSQSGGSAGAGAEKTPAGDYSVNTPIPALSSLRVS